MMWTNKQFWLDVSWRAFRTFCQSLAGLLVAVQTSSQMSSFPTISVPWYGYLYASGIAALVSLLQSVDRERAVEHPAVTPAVVPAPYVSPVRPTYSQPFAAPAAAYRAPQRVVKGDGHFPGESLR
jgi:hypothetical protein